MDDMKCKTCDKDHYRVIRNARQCVENAEMVASSTNTTWAEVIINVGKELTSIAHPFAPYLID